MPTWAEPLAPPPPKTKPTDLPVNHLASLEKSEWIFGSVVVHTLVYNSFLKTKKNNLFFDKHQKTYYLVDRFPRKQSVWRNYVVMGRYPGSHI